jgi:nucleotide sugar dehydrogenase
MSNKIGIIGLGFVGGAVKHSFEKHFEIASYDIDPAKSTSSISGLVDECIFIFITLPTPMKKDGSCDLTNIHTVLNEMNEYNKNGYEEYRVAIIKSSIPPGTTKSLAAQYTNIQIVFSPEFLTERNANQDFEKQEKVILGGDPANTEAVAHIFKKVCPLAHICETDFTTAEMVKFTINCFLATKVSVFNELYQVCKKLDIDYDNMIALSLLDNRIGSSHTAVPGRDGHFGYGGSCFPANVNIMIARAKELGVDTKVLRACWEKNLEMRPEKDWEQLRGRAVVK